MDEYTRLLGDYAIKAYEAVSIEWLVMLGLSCLIAGLVVYFNSSFHEDRAVSKRKIRAKHQKVIEEADAAITEALEARHRQGRMKREDVDFIYAMIRKGCPKFKELGPEPSFGKPWYYGTKLPEDANKVKASIITRLKNWGMTTKQIWDKRGVISDKRKSAHDDLADLVKSIKSKP